MTICFTEYKVRIIRSMKGQGRTRKELKKLLSLPFDKMHVLEDTLSAMVKEECIEYRSLMDRFYLTAPAKKRYTDEVLRDLLKRVANGAG